MMIIAVMVFAIYTISGLAVFIAARKEQESGFHAVRGCRRI